MSKRISIIGISGCTANVLMGAVDYFYTANLLLPNFSQKESKAFETQIVSPDGQAVTCANGYTVSVDGDLGSVKSGDIVICIPFAMTSPKKFIATLEAEIALTHWLGNSANNFELLVATGSGVFLLAEAGLMRNRTASTAWWFDSLFRQRYPNIRVDTKSHYIVNDNIMCSGLSNAWQYAYLSIVEKYVSKRFALTMSSFLMVNYAHKMLTPEAFISEVESTNLVVNKADVWIQRNLDKPMSTGDVARHISVSPRTLSRHFQSSLNISPKTYIQNARLDKCQLFLEVSEMTFSEIAIRCGYRDEAAFRRLFKKRFQLNPTEYRQQLRDKQKTIEQTGRN